MPLQEQFNLAGQEPGLQVWRIEKMDLVPVAAALHGQFYRGDCYIVMYTTAAPKQYNVHAWMGSNSSQDESCAAAIIMTQMDTHLGNYPNQFIEYEGDEGEIFQRYFKTGIVYKKGGVASGFNHVVANEHREKRLLKVKGRRHIRATEGQLSWSSFNSSDSFIIILDLQIYVWCGNKSNRFERLKANELAIAIRDTEMSGRGEKEIIDEGSEPEKLIEVLGPKPDLPTEADADKTDKRQDRNTAKVASLHLVSDADGSMDVTLVADENPFKQEMLSQNDCYILDNGANKKLFVWKGKDANPEERAKALERAQAFIKEKDYAPNTHVEIMPSGGETTLFKQFFFNWLDKDETTGPTDPYIIGKIAVVPQVPFDASELHKDKVMAAQHGMVDDGSGNLQIWRVEDGEKVPVDPSTYGQFYGGDCYLLLYTYRDEGREKYIIYTWQGQKCSQQELGASALLTVALDDSLGQKATQVRVPQGQEPPHLVSLFKNKPLVIHRGGTCKHGDTKPASKRLFHIRFSSNRCTRAVEVEPVSSSLNTNDVFLLKSPQSCFLWKGKGMTDEEVAAAKVVSQLMGGVTKEVEETSEPDEFWAALGGKGEYQTSTALRNAVKTPRLFAISNSTGRLIAEEIPPEFTQADLASDDIMILDTWDQIYLWIGKDARDDEKKGSLKIAEDYLDSDPSGRDRVSITRIEQGEEPLTFTGWFHAWDSEFWEKAFECLHAH
ncbi:scinderin like a [Nelusetta ayraudi]|uniref:scinderin like a n=1 Tax=Nelusetta ayraudi TaxID=303726 RepID=UPI003F6E6315